MEDACCCSNICDSKLIGAYLSAVTVLEAYFSVLKPYIFYRCRRFMLDIASKTKFKNM